MEPSRIVKQPGDKQVADNSSSLPHKCIAETPTPLFLRISKDIVELEVVLDPTTNGCCLIGVSTEEFPTTTPLRSWYIHNRFKVYKLSLTSKLP